MLHSDFINLEILKIHLIVDTKVASIIIAWSFPDFAIVVNDLDTLNLWIVIYFIDYDSFDL